VTDLGQPIANFIFTGRIMSYEANKSTIRSRSQPAVHRLAHMSACTLPADYERTTSTPVVVRNSSPNVNDWGSV